MKENFINNRKKLFALLPNKSVALFYAGEAMFKTADQTFPYEINRNFFYLTGLKKDKFILMMIKDENIEKEYLFIEPTNDYINKWYGKRLSTEESSEISGIKDVFLLDDFMGMFARIMNSDRRKEFSVPEYLYLDTHRFNSLKPLSFTFAKEILANFSELQVKSINEMLYSLRQIKEDWEIVEMRKAIDYTKKGIEAIMKSVTPFDNEKSLEAVFEYTLKVVGSEGVSFNTIMGSGKNGTVLHYDDNNCELQEDTLVLMDLGALSGPYCADITRTIPVSGKFTERQKQVYEAVLDVNKKCIEFVKPGILMKDLNKYAKDLLAEKCIELGLITDPADVVKYYYHSVSHFLGLDVHDFGSYDLPVKAGTILTIEPGLYIEEEAIGIRIEDDVLVTSDGRDVLSKDIVKEVVDIEKIVNK